MFHSNGLEVVTLMSVLFRLCVLSIRSSVFRRKKRITKFQSGRHQWCNGNMLESSVVDRGFEPRYIQTKGYAISMWCFSAEHAAIAREQKLFDSESGECVRIERHV